MPRSPFCGSMATMEKVETVGSFGWANDATAMPRTDKINASFFMFSPAIECMHPIETWRWRASFENTSGPLCYAGSRPESGQEILSEEPLHEPYRWIAFVGAFDRARSEPGKRFLRSARGEANRGRAIAKNRSRQRSGHSPAARRYRRESGCRPDHEQHGGKYQAGVQAVLSARGVPRKTD